MPQSTTEHKREVAISTSFTGWLGRTRCGAPTPGGFAFYTASLRKKEARNDDLAEVALVMADLGAFLAENAQLPWAWGSVDCCMVLADWAKANGRGDILAQYRGAYDDEAGCLAIVVSRGGLLPIIGDGCARVGLSTAEARAPGVIAVIGSLTAPTRQWGAIWDGERWLVRGPAGFAQVTAPTLGMWGV